MLSEKGVIDRNSREIMLKLFNEKMTCRGWMLLDNVAFN